MDISHCTNHIALTTLHQLHCTNHIALMRGQSYIYGSTAAIRALKHAKKVGGPWFDQTLVRLFANSN